MANVGYLKYSDSLVRTATVQSKDPTGAHDDYTVDVNYPLTNLKTIPVQRPTRIEIPAVSDTSINIQIDFGVASDFDLFVLAGHNLSSTATVKLYADTIIYPTTLIATLTWAEATMYYKFSSTQNYRYLQVEIDDANSTYDDISIGLIAVGEYTTTSLTIDEDWKYVNDAVNVKNSGDYITAISRNLFTRKRVTLPFSNVLESAFDGMVTLYNDLAQDVLPCFIIPDLTVQYGFIGRFTEELSRTYPHSATGSGAGDDLINASVTFIEDANPILLNGTQWSV